jgi:hypothetical protein
MLNQTSCHFRVSWTWTRSSISDDKCQNEELISCVFVALLLEIEFAGDSVHGTNGRIVVGGNNQLCRHV